MANIPIVKIGTDFTSFSKFTKNFSNFKKQTAKPQNIGFNVDKSSMAVLKSIASDLRVISQIQMGIISKSKRFRDVFESVKLQNPVIDGTATDKTDQKKISNFSNAVSKIAQFLKSVSASGVKRSLAFGARAIPQPVKDKWGVFSNRVSDVSKRIKENPLVAKSSAVFVDAIKKLTSVMAKLTAFSIRTGGTVLGSGIGKLFGALKAIPIVGGLALGAVTGSLFGIGGATNRATGLRTQARNTGLTTGQVLAGKNVLDPYIDFNGWAQQIAQEKTSINSANIFQQLGVGQNASTSDILVAKMRKAAEIARGLMAQGKGNLLDSDPFLKQWGIPAVDAQALGRLSPKELEQDVIGGFEKQSKNLNQDDSTSKKLQDLNTNLGITSDLIKNKFAAAIATIAPQIEKLASFFQNLLNNIFDPKTFKNISDLFQGGAKKLGEFLKDFNGIGSLFGILKGIFGDYLIKPLAKLIKDSLIDPLIKALSEKIITPLTNLFRNLNPFGNGGNPSIQKTAYETRDFGPLLQQPEWKTLPGGIANDNKSSSEWKKNQYLDNLNQKIGLPPKFFQALRQLESSNNDLAKNPGSSAAGAFQLTKATQKDYGVKNPYNFYESATGAGRYIDDAQHMFDNYRKSIVSYHMGKNGADKFFKRYGANWEANLKPQDKEYLRKFEQILIQLQRQQPQQVDININNNTATSPVVNAGMASKRTTQL
ncbi:transglycosylase SLT domain-containing protein [Commensalibacter nepenthis]|uniref:Transglycosylase SLT domain-containing protein n=1 Tax=Commensalibacter nepenthis TaxID=3043872 RepID=A0ABT6Q845_9PROT|nr:transglycosylase SLT domain-containing protein [Commensalibacter sp. TBRC 10068]MDI2113075.1 transglycosylase SLT domain-containing protein [Commensalibacter sp. TBRC 10068]